TARLAGCKKGIWVERGLLRTWYLPSSPAGNVGSCLETPEKYSGPWLMLPWIAPSRARRTTADVGKSAPLSTKSEAKGPWRNTLKPWGPSGGRRTVTQGQREATGSISMTSAKGRNGWESRGASHSRCEKSDGKSEAR